MNTILKNSILIALAGAIGISAVPASAGTVSKRVGYADLDLGNAAGQKRLEQRISRAVRQICGDYTGVVTPYELASVRRCKNEAWASTRSQVSFAIARAEGLKNRERLASR